MIISMKNGAFSYNQQTVFSGISMELYEGDFFCILGPNGCGKTTLLKCLCTMLNLKSGTIDLGGINIHLIPRKQRAASIGYVPQEEFIAFPFSVEQMVSIGRAPYIGYFSLPNAGDLAIVNRVLDRMGIAHMAKRIFNQLSGGEKQLVLIARALVQQPKLLLMDEPTSHLDFKNQNLIMQMVSNLAKDGIAVLMSTHTPDHVFTYATKAALMHNGNFISMGDPLKALTRDNLSIAYNMPVKLYQITDEDTKIQKTFCQPYGLGNVE